ncbi:ATP-binding cassette domain-containing protein [Candidatus Dependentiae bacterium]|nr:ATP-binding cassette domain-containing protein [Candidatus Dependentiae bacterium]
MNNTLIKIINLKKYYVENKKITKALDGISIDIFKGEIIGLLGANGAGKTTLSSILATLHPATDGEILFNNKSIYQDINEYRRHIGFCPQKPNLFNDLTVKQNLYFAGKFYNIPQEIIIQKINYFTSKYKLEDYLDSKPDILSGGYKQRILIARSLIHNPKLIILDEPTVGLDPHIRRQLWETIRELKKEGVTVILTTHYLDEAEILSDRICILDKGKIKLVDTPQNLNTAYQKSRLEDVFVQLMSEESE